MKYKSLFIAPLAMLGMAIAMPASADVNVSVRVGAPAFFGRIDIDGAPPPLLILPKPVIITPPSVQVEMEPLYLRVRPEESRNWRRYCNRYDACGRKVYFVKDRWYRNVYAPHYHSHHEEFERREHERMERERERMERERAEREHWREHRDDHRDDYRDDRRDNDDRDHDRRDDHDEHHDNGRRRHGPDHDDHR
ncbi:MAG TPA: hypothetical protein VHL14_09480 [Steroidobacteraceae bacterium]|nr:hypothetical protein [Steroidobacteraceae bacterium]